MVIRESVTPPGPPWHAAPQGMLLNSALVLEPFDCAVHYENPTVIGSTPSMTQENQPCRNEHRLRLAKWYRWSVDRFTR